MEVLAPMLGVIGMMVVIAWIVRIITTSRRQTRMAALQAEMQEKLLDKFGSSEEVIRYLESDAGRQFLDTATFEPTNPYRRILSSIQTGLVLTFAGGAFLFLRGQLSDADDAFVFLGALGVALGLGFICSAVATFLLSKSWGLVNGESGNEG
jgi:hypothetical protein